MLLFGVIVCVKKWASWNERNEKETPWGVQTCLHNSEVPPQHIGVYNGGKRMEVVSLTIDLHWTNVSSKVVRSIEKEKKDEK